MRYFACTGLLIKWHGSKTMRTVILTSASLVRSCHNEDNNIDKNLRVGAPNHLSWSCKLYNVTELSLSNAD